MVGGDAELGFCRHPSSEVSAPRFPVCGTIHHRRNLCRCTNINVMVASTSLRLQGRIKNEKQKLYALNVGCTLQGCTLYLVCSSRVQASIKRITKVNQSKRASSWDVFTTRPIHYDPPTIIGAQLAIFPPFKWHCRGCFKQQKPPYLGTYTKVGGFMSLRGVQPL